MNLQRHFNSITNRIITVGILLIMLGAFGRVFLLADFLRTDINKQASSQLTTLAQYVAKDIDQDIIERRDFLGNVSKKIPLSLLQNPKQLHIWLHERYNINPLFSKGMIVLDATGTIVVDSAAPPDHIDTSYTDLSYFQQATKGEFAIGRPVNSDATKVPFLPMAMPIKDSMGKVRAVLVGLSELHSANFLETIHNTHIGETGGLFLVSPQDKLFISASNTDIILTPIPKTGENKLLDQAMNGFRGAGISMNSQGVEELAAYTSIPSSGWFLVAQQPAKEAFAPVSHLRQYVINYAAILIPCFIFFMVLALRHMLRPLMNAAKHADLMTHGKIPFEPLPVVRNDEVGHLTDAFNRVLSKLLDSRAQLEHLAHHDTLTGLPNRQMLADRMEQALARAKRNQGQIAVLFLDLDGFKPINDEFGHKAGDLTLCMVASRLSDIVRREDTLARVGGDEFVILLCDLNDNARAAAELVATKCLAAFQQPFNIHNHACQLGTSIGIAIGRNECGSDRLLTAADHAMYKAKDAGRNQFYWAEECSTCSGAELHPVCDVNLIEARRV